MSGRWGCAEPGSLLPSLSLQGRLVYQEIRSCVLRGEKEKIGWVVRMDVVVRRRCVEIWGGFGVGTYGGGGNFAAMSYRVCRRVVWSGKPVESSSN